MCVPGRSRRAYKVNDRGPLPTSLRNAYHASLISETASPASTAPARSAPKVPARVSPAKASPSSRGRKAPVQVAKVENLAPVTDDQESSADPQAAPRPVASLDRLSPGASLGAAASATLRALNPVTIAKTVLPVRQTPVQQIAFYGTVAALAAVGVLEAPLAAVIIGGHLLHRSRNPIAESVGEALDEAR